MRRVVQGAVQGAAQGAAIEVARAVRFHSRLPAPRLPFEADAHAAPDLATLPRAVPLAALVVVLPAAGVLALCDAAGLPPLLAAGLGVAAGLLATGAMHEDGLADTADGFGGGATPERRLEIMRDSRVGTFGAAAVALSILLRTAALSELLVRHGLSACLGALLVAAMMSRVAAFAPLLLLPPARPTGMSADLGRAGRPAFVVALLLTGALSALVVALTPLTALSACGMALASCVASLLVARLAWRLIGGQTGDVAGCAQQLAEIGCLIAPLLGRPAP